MAQTFVQTHVQMFCMCWNERKLIENLSMRGRTRRDWVCPTRVWSCIWQVISTGRKQYKRIDLANSPVGGRTARIIQCMAFMSLCTYVYICLGYELRQSVAKNIISQVGKKLLVKTHFHWYAMNGGMRNEEVIRPWWSFDLYICSLLLHKCTRGSQWS